MLSPINPNLLIPTTDSVTALTTSEILADTTTLANVQTESPASIVELSAQAQNLLEYAAMAALDNEIQNAQAFQTDEEQLATLEVVAQAMLTQETDAAQKAALTEAEATVIDQALQSTIADAALSEAINTTAAANASAAVETVATVAAATVATPVTTTTTAAVASAVSTPPLIAAEVAEIQPTVVPISIIAGVINPETPITDPSVAAAIAAYHVGDSMFSEGETLAEDAPPETDIDVAPTPKIQGAKIDLHDSARDDALHGAAWNWLRINPIQRKSGKR